MFLVSIDCFPPLPFPGNISVAKVFHVACREAGNFSKKAFVVYWEEPKGMTYLGCSKYFSIVISRNGGT